MANIKITSTNAQKAAQQKAAQTQSSGAQGCSSNSGQKSSSSSTSSSGPPPVLKHKSARRRSESSLGLSQARKLCPMCTDQVPTACKTCKCGHVFYLRNRTISAKNILASANKNKGTSVTNPAKRTLARKVERPDFFSSPADHISPKKRRKQIPESPKRRVRPSERIKAKEEIKRATATPSPAGPEDDPVDYSLVTKEKLFQYSIILDDLNRKMCTQHFVPL